MLRFGHILLAALFWCGPAWAQGPAELVRSAREASAIADWDAAGRDLRAAIAFFDPGDPRHRANLAFLQNELSVVEREAGRGEEAMAAGRLAVELGADASEAADRAVYATNLGLAAADLYRSGEAERGFREAVALAASADRPDLEAGALRKLGDARLQAGDHAGAIEALTDALAVLGGASGEADEVRGIRLSLVQAHLMAHDPAAARAELDAAGPSDDPEALVLDGRIAIEEGRFDHAEDVLTQARDEAAAMGKDGALPSASALYNLSELLFMRGRFSESESVNQDAERAYARALGPDHPVTAQTVHRRAILHQELGDLETALTLFDQAADRLGRTVGADHPLWLSTRSEAAQTLERLGRSEEAVALARDVIARMEARPDGGGYDRVLATAGLGLILKEMGDPDALRVLEDARALREGHDYPAIDEPPGLIALGELYLAQERTAEAREAVDRGLDLYLATDGGTADRAGEARRVLAMIDRAEGDDAAALRLARENIRAAEAQLADLARESSYLAEFTPVPLRRQIGQALGLLWETQGRSPAATEEMFHAAQLLHLHEATRATNGFVARLQAADPRVASLLGQRADVTEALRAESLVLASGRQTDDAVLARLAALRARKAEIDASVSDLDSDAAAILAPSAVGGPEVAAALSPGEALWMQASFEDWTYLFLVTFEGVRVERTRVGSAEIAVLVDRLRASIDVTAAAGLPDFDFAAAEALHGALFAPLGEMVEQAQTLILVPDGAAQQVSLAILAREAPDRPAATGAGHERLRFLGLTHALAVIPSPTAFVRLRAAPQLGLAAGGFVGFGDPVLEGDGSLGTRGADAVIDRTTGLADPAVIRAVFEPLGSTTYELERMAEGRSAGTARVFLADEASEAQAKAFDYEGTSVLVFATHAIVAGDFDGLVEPALVMSPPEVASPLDDGLLTASEIGALSIGADIVILSACNTGSASGRPGAPGLSGLASGFFRAGARSLVVSHWTIRSASSVILMPRLLRAASGPDPVPPSESLRRAMLEMASDTRVEDLDHPALWAPFTVIGDR